MPDNAYHRPQWEAPGGNGASQTGTPAVFTPAPDTAAPIWERVNPWIVTFFFIGLALGLFLGNRQKKSQLS